MDVDGQETMLVVRIILWVPKMFLHACMQISCVGVRSYGLVCTPANLPPCLERLSLATKAWGRRVGPSLLLFSPKDLPNLKVWLARLYKTPKFPTCIHPVHASVVEPSRRPPMASRMTVAMRLHACKSVMMLLVEE